LLEPPVVRPDSLEGVSPGYRGLFDALEQTLVTTGDRGQLLGASRELEDRAFRVGTGTLRVSFQRFSAFGSQVETYRHLASETALDIHVYGESAKAGENSSADGVPDWEPPDIEGVTYHATENPEIERHWAIGFDGGDGDQQACGLLARETNGEYEGFWTYDPGTVETLLNGLRASGE
jgi:DICT domain-containing protein